jgi:hypothetical protein
MALVARVKCLFSATTSDFEDGWVARQSPGSAEGDVLAMTVANDTLRSEIFARLEAHLEKSKREVRVAPRPDPLPRANCRGGDDDADSTTPPAGVR